MKQRQVRSNAGRLALGLVALLTLPAIAVGGPTLADLPQAWHDEQGRPVALNVHSGHRLVLTMAYARCHRICPATIAALKRVQQRLDERGTSVDFVIVGYDPAHEDAASWRHYRAVHHLDRANWSFLGGSRADTERLAQQLGFEFWTYDEHVMHGSRVVVFDPSGVQVTAADPTRPGWAAAL
jgi:cytochrome oxidase Cu insertion factor (SCO1/SenC/PrrC family)